MKALPKLLVYFSNVGSGARYVWASSIVSYLFPFYPFIFHLTSNAWWVIRTPSHSLSKVDHFVWTIYVFQHEMFQTTFWVRIFSKHLYTVERQEIVIKTPFLDLGDGTQFSFQRNFDRLCILFKTTSLF